MFLCKIEDKLGHCRLLCILGEQICLTIRSDKDTLKEGRMKESRISFGKGVNRRNAHAASNQSDQSVNKEII